MSNKIKTAAEYILQQVNQERVSIGLILGSGLAGFANHVEVLKEISYSDIPNFPMSTVVGHKSKLILAQIQGKKLWILAGRFHYYEGYDTQDVVMPIRVLKLLGVETLCLTNAAGGLNPNFKQGDFMVIKDHVSLFVPNPLIGRNDDSFGTRFPDMSNAYDKNLQHLLHQTAQSLNISLQTGVYFGLSGPTYETQAECHLIKILGGDAVGMSTVMECIVANHCGMKVAGVSVITNIINFNSTVETTHTEVLEVANQIEPKMVSLFTHFISRLV
ncbi:MAG: purine-nucleoside phosphorylase [Alphaproteobacteria bacterium]|nr:purine-nucleoside phosphorylase [Alphaproteobacteria bacterium]